MTRARKELISLEATPYYHCVSRCVRRAFLCGQDKWSRRSYEHRREWIVDRIKLLSRVFCIDVCAYAVMSNHWHIVMRVDVDRAKALTQEQVITRWRSIYSGNVLVNRYLNNVDLTQAEIDEVGETTGKWRERLTDISWFMRCVNETIAREANAEDQCTGRFWEGRFKSQALLDEAAILACMVYVDLNSVRAGIAETPENSNFTSIQDRIAFYGKRVKEVGADGDKRETPDYLACFSGSISKNKKQGIPFGWVEYLNLLDWTGRAICVNKRGYIAAHHTSIIERLGLDEELWLSGIKNLSLMTQSNLHVNKVFLGMSQNAA